MPLVTVALQFYNAERTLAVAVRSVLNQTFRDWELLLQDDGSTDGSLAVARGFRDQRVRVLSDGVNRKRPGRINEALQLAAGQFFALMDADDAAYPQRLDHQVAFLNREPDVDLAGGGMLVFGRDGLALGKRIGATDHEAICSRPWDGFPLAQPTFMGRTEWFRRFGYRDGAAPTEDQDLLVRSYRSSRFANLSELLVGYREETLTIRKQALGRRQVASALVHEFLRQRRPLAAARAAVGQGVKLAVDTISIASGLRYKVLRHRARGVSADEARAWAEVWRAVQGRDGSTPQ